MSEEPEQSSKQPQRPIELRKPSLAYRYDMTFFQAVLCAVPVWVLICVSAAAWLAFTPSHTQYSYIGMGDAIYMLQGVAFCVYFLIFAVIARAVLGWGIALLLIGVVFPFWGSMFLIVAGGIGATLVIPVAWLTCVMFAFSFSWRKHLVIAGIAFAIFSLWSLLNYMSREHQLFFMLDIDELVGMAIFWHCMCVLVCALGINERRRVIRDQWHTYVRYRPTCPSCRYRFKGLPKSATLCPECGSVIPIWVRDVAPERAALSTENPDS
jgi:hypothetical protein